MSTSKTIVFFGNERLATGVTSSTPILRRLLAEGYKVAAIVSHYETSRSRSSRELEIKAVAAAHRIPLYLPDKPAELIETLRGLQADAGVLVAYGKLVPSSVIELFAHGIINVHPSLLPRHRGPTPIESAILSGEPTGTSLMQLVKAMDAGPVYAQQTGISVADTSKQALTEELLTASAELLARHLPAILAGRLHPVVQDESAATYDQLLDKTSGRIDWTKPAVRLEREVRAFLGWPRSRTQLAGKDVVLTDVRPAAHQLAPGRVLVDRQRLFVGCGEASLEILSLTPPGKANMPAAAFLAGYGSSL